VLTSIVEHEVNARAKLLEADPNKLFDKIGRAHGILQNCHLLSSSEAMNLLSLLRLGVDLGVFPDANRSMIDRLFIEAQPGHLQHAQKGEFEPTERDLLRAARLRAEFANFARPSFTLNNNNNGKN
jgi:protein arginine kinase